jgi:hypothetical protein
MKYEVHFKTIIISSIGAIPGFTLHNFADIIGNEKVSETTIWGKRIVITALRGSFELWMRASPGIYR